MSLLCFFQDNLKNVPLAQIRVFRGKSEAFILERLLQFPRILLGSGEIVLLKSFKRTLVRNHAFLYSSGVRQTLSTNCPVLMICGKQPFLCLIDLQKYSSLCIDGSHQWLQVHCWVLKCTLESLRCEGFCFSWRTAASFVESLHGNYVVS